MAPNLEQNSAEFALEHRAEHAGTATSQATPTPESTQPAPQTVETPPSMAEPMRSATVAMDRAAESTVGESLQPHIVPRTSSSARIARSSPAPSFKHAPSAATATKSIAPRAPQASEMISENIAPPAAPMTSLPAGATRQEQRGFATVQVFYATDRARGALPLSAYEVTGKKQAFVMLAGCCVLLLVFSAFNWLRGQSRAGKVSALAGSVTGMLAAACIAFGQANIEKHGVTYSGDRGTLTRGICEVTVPDVHQRGIVERPSLMRFEIREDQQKHIVLTSAVELSGDDFHRRLSETVSNSPHRDLLVFIHGYNVDFESAVQRTAQIAVDLPFEGVPVCYSWPSQGSLLGYSIDETNAEWTMFHLKEFLLELANESGAESINVVAHSMGNRPMTAAMEQIQWQLSDESGAPFDRIVLAAPDVDADRFRRDLAPSLLNVAEHVTLYASSDDQALIASKQVHGYPRAGESGEHVVVVPGVETIDVSGIDLSLLGHSYYGDNESMLRDLYDVVRARLPAPHRAQLIARRQGDLLYWQLAQRPGVPMPTSVR